MPGCQPLRCEECGAYEGGCGGATGQQGGRDDGDPLRCGRDAPPDENSDRNCGRCSEPEDAGNEQCVVDLLGNWLIQVCVTVEYGNCLATNRAGNPGCECQRHCMTRSCANDNVRTCDNETPCEDGAECEWRVGDECTFNNAGCRNRGEVCMVPPGRTCVPGGDCSQRRSTCVSVAWGEEEGDYRTCASNQICTTNHNGSQDSCTVACAVEGGVGVSTTPAPTFSNECESCDGEPPNGCCHTTTRVCVSGDQNDQCGTGLAGANCRSCEAGETCGPVNRCCADPGVRCVRSSQCNGVGKEGIGAIGPHMNCEGCNTDYACIPIWEGLTASLYGDDQSQGRDGSSG